jgi:hypothetical protein
MRASKQAIDAVELKHPYLSREDITRILDDGYAVDMPVIAKRLRELEEIVRSTREAAVTSAREHADSINYLRDDALERGKKISELLAVCLEALAMLTIYYIPNSDGSTPTISRLKAMIEKAKERA